LLHTQLTTESRVPKIFNEVICLKRSTNYQKQEDQRQLIDDRNHLYHFYFQVLFIGYDFAAVKNHGVEYKSNTEQ